MGINAYAKVDFIKLMVYVEGAHQEKYMKKRIRYVGRNVKKIKFTMEKLVNVKKDFF